MNSDKQNLSDHRPELAATEAALGGLTPSVSPDFTDELKQAVKREWSDEANADQALPGDSRTQNVSVPLTHYIRIAQFNAAFLGMIGGLLIGVFLGGAGVYFVMDLSRQQTKKSQAIESPKLPTYAEYRKILQDDPALRAMEYERLKENP
jgi:hypothetical protein